MDLTHDIPATGPGSFITVRTELGAQSVRDGFDVNLFGRITNGADGGWEMGPLLPGPNVVEVRLDDSDPSASVTVAFDPMMLAV